MDENSNVIPFPGATVPNDTILDLLPFDNVDQARATLTHIELAAQLGLRVLDQATVYGEEAAWAGARQVLGALARLLSRMEDAPA